MKKLSILITLFILLESICYSQIKPRNEIVVFESISSMKPRGIKKLSPEYKSFIQKLSQSVLKKDTTLLLSLVDDNVEIAAGGGVYGKENFLNIFLKSTNENAWLFLFNVLHMGGIFENYENNEHLVFPYQRSNLFYQCTKGLDSIPCSPYCIYYGIETTLTFLKEPTEKAEVLVNLSYPILVKYYDTIDNNEKFHHVRTYDKKYSGWIQKNKVHCDADRFIEIKKVKNELKITTITPFD